MHVEHDGYFSKKLQSNSRIVRIADDRYHSIEEKRSNAVILKNLYSLKDIGESPFISLLESKTASQF